MTAQPSPVTLTAATRFWFQLGWVSFGGPAGQIALLHRELVERLFILDMVPGILRAGEAVPLEFALKINQPIIDVIVNRIF